MLQNQQAFFTAIKRKKTKAPAPSRGRFQLALKERKLWNELLDLEPSRYLPHLSCPLIIVHGTADLQVSTSQADKLLKAAEQSGVRATKHLCRGYDHLFKRVGARRKSMMLYHDRRRRIPREFATFLAKQVKAHLALAPIPVRR